MAIRRNKNIRSAGPWNSGETVGIVKLYERLSILQQAGKLGRGKGKTSKAALVRAFSEETGRSRGSVEAKLMNVSAVVEDLLPLCKVALVLGYRPLPNLAKELREVATQSFRIEDC
jgi:hypothetical protein